MDDDDSSDDDDSPDYTAINENFERVGHQLVLRGSISRKRSATEDIEYLQEEEESDGDQLQRRTKRRHDLPVQDIQPPPSPPQQTTQSPPSPPPQPTEPPVTPPVIPTTSTTTETVQPLPPPSEPEIPTTFTPSDPASNRSRIEVLEAEVATLKARLISHDALLQQIT